MKVMLTLTLCVVLIIAMVIGVQLKQIPTVFLSVIIPIIIFLSTYWLVTGLRKKILSSLKKTFGDNVVKIASAIIEYFEVPLTIILSVSLILFIMAVSAVVLILPRLAG